MIPLRKVAEQLGYTVTWDPDDQSVRVEMNIAYIIVKPGEDWYERIGTIKKVNLNHIFQYGAVRSMSMARCMSRHSFSKPFITAFHYAAGRDDYAGIDGLKS